MYDDNNPTMEYDGAAEIPKEIQKIRDPIIFNLTKRELFFVSAGIGLAALSLWILFRVIGVTHSSFVLIPVLLAFPCGLFAFIRPMGLNLEDWLTIWISNNLKSAPVRKLFAQNEYEKVLELADIDEEKTRIKSRKKKQAGRKKSAYKIRQ